MTPPIQTVLSAAPTPVNQLHEIIRVGIVQTIVHPKAWDGNDLTMDAAAVTATWQSIEAAFHQFRVLDEPPHVLLIPEVSVPRSRYRKLCDMAAQLPTIVVAGMDFHFPSATCVENRAAVLIPSNWPDPRPTRRCKTIFVGKTYPAVEEKSLIANSNPARTFRGNPTLWLFDAGPLGRFAVCLCFDFMDVERLPLYRGQIQHLFVLAYNRDTVTFDHVAESLCRTLFCNVIVCNTGYFGGSSALTPYARHFRRPVYQIRGQQLATSQIFTVPVRSISHAQRNGDLGTKKSYDELKALPPGLPKI